MALRVSRRRIAAYAADKLVSGAASSLVLREVAA
jgi:hypothetical protein